MVVRPPAVQAVYGAGAEEGAEAGGGGPPPPGQPGGLGPSVLDMVVQVGAAPFLYL